MNKTCNRECLVADSSPFIIAFSKYSTQFSFNLICGNLFCFILLQLLKCCITCLTVGKIHYTMLCSHCSYQPKILN